MIVPQNWQNQRIGRYLMIRPLRQDDEEETWLAEDPQLHRLVAMHVLPVVRAADRAYLQSFEQEVRVAAKLEHPNILPIHDFGSQHIAGDAVLTYLITPYLGDKSLQERIESAHGPLPFPEGLHYLRQAAQAIDYAHQQHILHRRIRPASMQLQESRLFLTGFGLANMLISMPQQNQKLAGIGPPEYLAPEQALGRAEPASDRYSLAVLAYQLFTGNLPFTGETGYSIVMQHITEPPPLPRQFNAAVPPKAEEAIMRALSRQPDERPPTCMAFVDLLEQGMQVLALHDAFTQPSHYQRRSTPAPHPHNFQEAHAPTALSNQVQEATTVPQCYPPDAPTYRSDQAHLSVPVTEASAHPREPRKIARRAVVVGGGAIVALAAASGAVFLATHSYSPPRSPSLSTRSRLARAHATPGPAKLVSGSPLLSLVAHTQEIGVAKWDPTGRYLVTGGADSFIMLWDIAAALQQNAGGVQAISTPLRRWKLPNPIFANRLRWSSDGRMLAVILDDKQADAKIAIYDAFNAASTPEASYQVATTANIKLSYPSLDWSPVANTFATSSYRPGQLQQRVLLWQSGITTMPLRTFTSNSIGKQRTLVYDPFDPMVSETTVDTVAWSSDGTLLAGYTNFGSVTIWETATGKVKGELHLSPDPHPRPQVLLGQLILTDGGCLAWSPTETNMLAVSDIERITLWDVQQQKLLLTLKPNDPTYFITGLSWSSNGRYLAASAAGSARLYVWDLQAASTTRGGTVAPLLSFPQHGMQVHKQSITAIDWSPDGRYLVSASADTTAVVWKVAG